jgi:hypothetical protein
MENSIEEIDSRLRIIEEMLAKPSSEWSVEEKDTHGNKEELRAEKKALNEQQTLLIEQKTYLIEQKTYLIKERFVKEEKEVLLVKERVSQKEAERDTKKPRLEEKIDLDLKETDIPDQGKWFNVPGLNYAGIAKANDSIKKMFCRDETLKLLTALNDFEKGIQVTGPPGVGKSVTTWFWICHQVHKYNKSALWVHLGRNTISYIIRLAPGESNYVSGECERILHDASEDIVVLDGVTEDRRSLIDSIYCRNFLNRKSVIVASTALKKNYQDLTFNKIHAFSATSWSIEDYYAAVENNDFYDGVKNMLTEESTVTSNGTCTMTPRQLVDQKYYFAGRSARWMFDFPLDQVKEFIEDSFSRVVDYGTYLDRSVGSKSPIVVNHLISSDVFFTSPFIARLFLRRGVDKDVHQAYGIALGLRNPTFTGWVVEMDFILQLIASKNNENSSMHLEPQIELKVSHYVDCNTDSSESILESVEEYGWKMEDMNNIWLLPTKWNQGGYDVAGFYVEGDLNILKFIQVTNAESHALKLSHFKTLAENVESAFGCNINGIEIYFVLPKDVGKLKISTIEGSGSLCKWNVGKSDQKWTKDIVCEHVIEARFTKRTR